MHFNPADVQTIGIGLAAFLSTLISIFIFLSAHKERLGRAMATMLAMIAIWSWFGFFYEIVSDLALARELRVVSVMGIVWLSVATIHFACVYLEERKNIGLWGRGARLFGDIGAALLTLALVADLFGGRYVVGNLVLPTNQVLAPNAGPLMALVIVYYALCILISALLFAARARAGTDTSDRRQAELIFSSLIVALVLGGTRFAPWYGFDFQPLVGGLAAPLFAFAAFYSIKRYKLFNVQVAAAQLLIFAIWTFTFFRILLNASTGSWIPDAVLFCAVLLLGVFLLQSIIKEIRVQKELAQLTIEHVKSEFITVASHQLRTPLTAVRWIFTLLSQETLSDKQRELITRGSSATNNMVLIVNDLLSVARMSEGSTDLFIEPGDVSDAVRAGGVLFEDAAKDKNIRLTFDLPASPLQARFDRGKLALVIENLIDNAVKYTPNGGSVTVRAGSEKGKMFVSVTDTGIGIPSDEQARLFEKFFRGKSAIQMFPNGSGLGLFIAKHIIDGHHGSLTITPQEEGGTRAIVTLPPA